MGTSGYCPHHHSIPVVTASVPTLSRYTCTKSQSLSQVNFKSPLQTQAHKTNMIQRTASAVIVIVQSSSSQIKQSVQRDMRPCRMISQSTDSKLSRVFLHYCSITITSFPLPWHYCDVCPLNCHYRGKIHSTVPITTVLRWITVVIITVQLSNLVSKSDDFYFQLVQF